jgi:hypothetical protein
MWSARLALNLRTQSTVMRQDVPLTCDLGSNMHAATVTTTAAPTSSEGYARGLKQLSNYSLKERPASAREPAAVRGRARGVTAVSRSAQAGMGQNGARARHCGVALPRLTSPCPRDAICQLHEISRAFPGKKIRRIFWRTVMSDDTPDYFMFAITRRTNTFGEVAIRKTPR